MKRNTKRNCKDGLSSRQEHLARQIRKDLLDEQKKEKHYEELRNLWTSFFNESCRNLEIARFDDYLKEKNPELRSAFKRLGINIITAAISVTRDF